MSTVWHNGQAISTSAPVLESLGLRDGQTVTAAQFWEVLTANASAMSADMHMHNLLHPHAKVDVSGLDESLARVGRRRR